MTGFSGAGGCAGAACAYSDLLLSPWGCEALALHRGCAQGWITALWGIPHPHTHPHQGALPKTPTPSAASPNPAAAAPEFPPRCSGPGRVSCTGISDNLIFFSLHHFSFLSEHSVFSDLHFPALITRSADQFSCLEVQQDT